MHAYSPNSADLGMTKHSLRIASLDDDVFLFQLFVERNRTQFAPLGWSDIQLHPMLQMQYRARAASYEQRFPNLDRFVICGADGSPIGEILMHRTERESRVIDICLSPEQQGQGIGTELLLQLQSAAARNGVSMTLNVDHGNPARTLYERLGFYETGRNALQTEMRWELVRSNKGQLAKG
jgi:ribosomal protein S18 acetylase RimI-like enzyme